MGGVVTARPEVGTLGVRVESGVRAVEADAAVFVAAVSDEAVSLVVGAGAVVESPVVDGTGVGAATVPTSVGCLVVVAVATVDVVTAADGVPAVAGVLVGGVTLGVTGVGILGGEVASGAVGVVREVEGVAVGGGAPVVDTCWVVAPSMWAVETLGDHGGDDAVVAVVEATACVVSVTAQWVV